jgi:hypothetical protein
VYGEIPQPSITPCRKPSENQACQWDYTKEGCSTFPQEIGVFDTPISAFQLTPLVRPIDKNLKTEGNSFVIFALDGEKVEN